MPETSALSDGRFPTPSLGILCALQSPVVAEILARTGFDYVWVDLQHGFADFGALTSMCQAIETGGSVPVVRVPELSAAQIGMALDRGAHAVVVPMVETAAQAREAVAACRYPPDGTRSYGPFRARQGAPCLAMIETVAGVAAREGIVAVPGLGGVYVGPSDLAISMGLDPDYPVGDGAHDEAIASVAEACRRAGVRAAVQTGSAAEARRRLAQGFDMVSVRTDVTLLSSAAAELRGAVSLTR